VTRRDGPVAPVQAEHVFGNLHRRAQLRGAVILRILHHVHQRAPGQISLFAFLGYCAAVVDEGGAEVRHGCLVLPVSLEDPFGRVSLEPVVLIFALVGVLERRVGGVGLVHIQRLAGEDVALALVLAAALAAAAVVRAGVRIGSGAREVDKHSDDVPGMDAEIRQPVDRHRIPLEPGEEAVIEAAIVLHGAVHAGSSLEDVVALFPAVNPDPDAARVFRGVGRPGGRLRIPLVRRREHHRDGPRGLDVREVVAVIAVITVIAVIAVIAVVAVVAVAVANGVHGSRPSPAASGARRDAVHLSVDRRRAILLRHGELGSDETDPFGHESLPHGVAPGGSIRGRTGGQPVGPQCVIVERHGHEAFRWAEGGRPKQAAAARSWLANLTLHRIRG